MEIVIAEFKIERRVRAMAHKLSEDHKASGNPDPPVLICILNGAFMFFSDLVKDMGIEIEVDFIRARSYTGTDNSAGVAFTKELEIDLTGKRVYIVDDMVDTGKTMNAVLDKVKALKPSEVKIVTLVDRKSGTFKVDHTCFPDMGEEWFVGYGFDLDGLCRNYRNIYDSKSK
ncbi:MAG: phosphoribosyltransferase family protein [Bacteroidetes bacterium]|jgi:hypoxanthine phosphoribosyltransferase|nr:phosphoribosyltransferase family protein [Bacteroidota bacterium]